MIDRRNISILPYESDDSFNGVCGDFSKQSSWRTLGILSSELVGE